MDFADQDTTAATSHSPPTISVDVQNVLAQLCASVDLIQFELLEHKDDQKDSIQVGAAALDTIDVRREVKAVNAKVDILSSRLDDVKKDVEATKEATSHQRLEFQIVSEPFRLLRKRWVDVCLEAVEFCASRKLLPVGSLKFCRYLSIVEPDSSFSYRQQTVFALRFSQFCTVYIQYSLFSWLPTADITDFLSYIAMDRTVFKSVQIAQNTVSVAPILQLIDEHSSSDSTSDDISMDFADQDTTAATSHSPPTISADVQNVLAQLRASVDLIQFELLEHKDDVKLLIS
ncbi:hypothetical protein F511_22370 [Dorcoceras hygrometricum]|uniref:Uncharacterized protein n=1 Tax=Dorcoceras hygrometricum TaxID=472368 RepID=A0A2Z7C3P9_9LAMI|nr:hypothetical protein F511_22370 [Dorcoceras hygrometricum]